jgi:hypothetical protein
MSIKTISCKRIKNLGNYESEHLEVFAEVDEGEDPSDVAQKLREFVVEQLQVKVPPDKRAEVKPPPTDKYATDF